MIRVALGATWVCLTFAAAPLGAQAVSGSVSGVVRDTLGRPLEGAVLVLNPMEARRAVRTDVDGRFRFDRVSSGRYAMRTNWIGYLPDERTIEVPNEGLHVTITLTPVAFRLDTFVVVGRRTGIFGTTAYREDLRALENVEVSVLGTRHRIRTSSSGKFAFGDVRAGGWVVKAVRDGFETMLLSVAVPDTAGVELSLAMDTIRTKAQAIRNNRMMDLQMRVNRSQLNSAAIVPHQELATYRRQSLDVALRYSPTFLIKGLVIQDVECVFINGMAKPTIRAKDIAADDVAMVEVYNHRGFIEYRDRQAFRSNGQDCGVGRVMETYGEGNRRMSLSRPPRSDIVAFIHIWLK